jgi:hypothetical protein
VTGDNVSTVRFLEQLGGGDLGARVHFPASIEALEEAPQAALLRDPERRVAWEIAFVPVHLDLRDATHSELLADLEGEARAAFEATWTALGAEAGASERPPARTADQAWSPLVLVERPRLDDARALRVIHRMSYEPGHELVDGRLLVPTAQGVLTLAASSLSRATGYRESARLMAAMASREGADPEAVRRELGQAGLDEEAFDLLFPDHPLSLVRAALAWLLDVEGGDLTLTSIPPALDDGEVELAAPGCAITPPPRYALMAAGTPTHTKTLAVLTRVGLAATTPRLLDVWRLEDTLITGADREGQLARLARKNAEDWAGEGARCVDARVSKLPSSAGRAHVKSHVRFTGDAGPMRSAARWMADTDGVVFRVSASGGAFLSEKSLLADAEQALASLRRFDPPAAPRPRPVTPHEDSAKPKRTWWPFG